MKTAATAPQRIAQDEAFVLHHYDWSESSVILEVFSRQLGRISLVAKGAKKPTSNFRPILLPLLRLELAYSLPRPHEGSSGGGGEIGTLKAAHWASSYTLPQGDALLAGFYCNELLLKLLPRLDAQPALFDLYAQCVALLALQGKPQAARLPEPIDTALTLRAFELLLLRQLGLLPALDTSASGHPVQAHLLYHLVADEGLRLAPESDTQAHHPQLQPCLSGAHWRQLHAALHQGEPFTALLTALLTWDAPARAHLRRSLGHVLHQHLGAPLKTRQMMAALQGL